MTYEENYWVEYILDFRFIDSEDFNYAWTELMNLRKRRKDIRGLQWVLVSDGNLRIRTYWDEAIAIIENLSLHMPRENNGNDEIKSFGEYMRSRME